MTQSAKQQALDTIAALSKQHGLTLQDIQSALAINDGNEHGSSKLMTRVLSYIGGTLIFAGIVIFVGVQWDSISSLARIIITLGTGCVFYILAILAHQDSRYTTLGLPLLLISAVLQPVGMLVGFAELGSGADEQLASTITAGTFATQFGITFTKWRETITAWLTLFFASMFAGLALDLIGLHWSTIMLLLGATWLGVGVISQRSIHAAVSGQLFLLGCWAFLSGLFDKIEDTMLESTFIIAACALVYLGVWIKSRALNLASMVALLAYTGYFTSKYFADSIGWPIALIIIGLLIIGISYATLRIDRRYLRNHSA